MLEAWRSGDLEAGARLFERHYDSVARFFSNKVPDEQEDLIQATFLACLEAIEDFRGEASFRTLLFAIARYQLYRYLRRRGRDTKYLSQTSRSVAESAPSWTTMIAAHDRQQQLLLALRTLPLDTQLMLQLFYWEGLPVKEIAGVFDLSINTVKTRMRRGRLALARELGSSSSPGPFALPLPHEHEHLCEGFEGWAREVQRAQPGAGLEPRR